MEARAEAIALTAGAAERKLATIKDAVGQLVELRLDAAAPSVATVRILEQGSTGEEFTATFQLGPGSAEVVRVEGSATIFASIAGANGSLHWRALDDGRTRQKPPVDLRLALPVLSTTIAGYRPPHRRNVTVYVDFAPELTVAWYTPAGVQSALCPVGIAVPVPPGHELKIVNTSAANPHSAVIVWS